MFQLTSYINFFRQPTIVAWSSVVEAVSSEVDDSWGSSNSSFDHSVNRQNSSPTRQISPVLLHTQVGVPLKDISFSSSCHKGSRGQPVAKEGRDRMGRI